MCSVPFCLLFVFFSPFFCLCVHLTVSVCLYIFVSIYLFLYVCLFVSLSICVCACAKYSSTGTELANMNWIWQKARASNIGCHIITSLRNTPFFIFWVDGPFSAWILVKRVYQTIKASREAIWQVSEDRYHTELVSLGVNYFLFCLLSSSTNVGGGS